MKSFSSLVLAGGLILASASAARAQIGVSVTSGYGGTGVSIAAGGFGYGGFGGYGGVGGYGYGLPGVSYYGSGYQGIVVPAPAYPIAPAVAPVYVAPVTPFYGYRPYVYRPFGAPFYPVGYGRPFVGGVPHYGARPGWNYPGYRPYRRW
jgi:hypothetical protein